MKCFIVNDLLPEYIEKLCSEETSKEIENHIASCKKCQDKLKSLTAGSSEDSLPTVSNPFLKIQKQIKAERTKKIILIVAIAIISSVFLFLTVGQMFPRLGIPNYDTIKYHYKTKQIAKDILVGKTEVILDGYNHIADQSPRVNFEIFRNESNLYSDVNSGLKSLHSEIFDGKNVKIGVIGVNYNDYSLYYTSKTTTDKPYTSSYTASVTLEGDGVYIPLQIDFLSDSAYIVSIYFGTNKSDSPVAQFDNYCMYYLDAILGDDIYTYILRTLMRPDRHSTTFNIAEYYMTYDCNSMERDEDKAAAYRSKVSTSLSEIYSKQETIALEMTNITYNSEEKCFDAKLFWQTSDLNGNKAIMIKEFRYGPFGYEPKDDTEIIYADAGFDSNLIDDLRKLFDK